MGYWKERAKQRYNLAEPSKPAKKSFYFGMADEQAQNKGISRETLGDVMIQEPMIRKAIWKENKDIFSDGWEVIHKDEGMEIDENDQILIEDFNKKTSIKSKLELGGVSANTYGDGFIEIVFEELNANIEDDIPTSAPVDLNVLDASYICNTKRKSGSDDTEYYIYKTQPLKGKSSETYMHPDRIIHIVKKRLPGKLFGISDVFTCSKILTSKMNADVYFGEFIEWAGSGVFDATLNGASDTDLKEAEKKLKTRKKINLHDENTTWQVLNPAVFSPKEYYDYFFINIAASMDMPQHILTGVQPGQLTGSEIGLTDYYKNITNLQRNVFTPILERIYTLLLEANGRSFEDYEIAWNPIYIDETSEAQILLARAQAGKLLMDSYAINEDEYRAIVKDGIQELSGESVLEGNVEVRPEPAPIIQPFSPKQVEVPVETQRFYANLLTTEEKMKIEKEKLLGKIELELQDKRIQEAKEKAKVKQ